MIDALFTKRPKFLSSDELGYMPINKSAALFTAGQVFDNLTKPNPRDCIKIARLAKGNIDKVNQLVESMKR